MTKAVDRELAEVDEAPVPGQWPAAETTGVVADYVERAESVDKATDHALTRRDEGTRPDEDSSQRRCWPHGGRQLSWWCHGRCHIGLSCEADGRWRHPGRACT